MKGIFNVPEDTYHRAFLLNGFVAGLASALLIEYRYRDPLSLYKDKEKTHMDTLQNIGLTIVLGIITSYIAFWATRFCIRFWEKCASH